MNIVAEQNTSRTGQQDRTALAPILGRSECTTVHGVNTINNLPEIPTVTEVSATFGIPEATLRWYRSRGLGPKSFRLGRRIRYHKADVLAWLEQQEARSAKSV